MDDLKKKVMGKLQEEWESISPEKKEELRHTIGIRSTQIYSVISLLVNLGIIKEEHFNGS